MRYWLLKTEPTSYSIDHLERDTVTHWDGIRNYQARNFLRDDFRPGDLALFYHSSTEIPGVAGIAVIEKAGYADPSALDPDSKYFDPKATPDEPRWFMVDIRFKERFTNFVPLELLKSTAGLETMVVTTKSRLSVQPVTPEEFSIVASLGRD